MCLIQNDFHKIKLVPGHESLQIITIFHKHLHSVLKMNFNLKKKMFVIQFLQWISILLSKTFHRFVLS